MFSQHAAGGGGAPQLNPQAQFYLQNQVQAVSERVSEKIEISSLIMIIIGACIVIKINGKCAGGELTHFANQIHWIFIIVE